MRVPMVNSSLRSSERDPTTQDARGLPPASPKYSKSIFRTRKNAAGYRLSRLLQQGWGVRMCLYGGIAQLVERRLCKPNVAGSSPTASTKHW